MLWIMNQISNEWLCSGEKTFEDFAAMHSSASGSWEIRENLKNILEAYDKCVSIRYFFCGVCKCFEILHLVCDIASLNNE